MFDRKSRSKIGAASLISLGYLGTEEPETQEQIKETSENVNEMEIE